MQITVQVVNVENGIEIEKQSGGVYPGSRLTYRYDGKIQEQCWHNTALKYNKGVADTLKQIKAGDTVTIEKEKNEKTGYWEVKSLTIGGEVKQVTSKSESAPSAKSGGNWETAEERAKKQVYIVRQSSISAAIDYFKVAPKADKKGVYQPLKVEDIIDVAKQFEAHVFDTQFDDGSIESLPQDKFEEEIE